MSNSKLTLQSLSNGKKVIITADGPSSANIVLPTDYTVFEFMEASELESAITAKLFPESVLQKPVITSPINNANDYQGGVTLEPYDFPDFKFELTVSTVYELSRFRDFHELTFKIVKTGNEVIHLTEEDFINSGIEGQEPNGRYIDYYLRVKVFCNNYSSVYSDTVVFRYTSTRYKEPIINVMEMEEVVQLENGERVLSSEAGNHAGVKSSPFYSGNMIFEYTEPIPLRGSPGEPDYIELHIEQQGTRLEKTFQIPYTDDIKRKYVNRFIPFVMYPGGTYEVRMNYWNSENNVRSPLSQIKVITIPNVKVIPYGLHVDQYVGSLSSLPTFGLKNLLCDFDFLDYGMDDLPDCITNEFSITERGNELNVAKISYEFVITRAGAEVYRKTFTDNLKDIYKIYNKGKLATLEDTTLLLSTEYKLELNLTITKDGVPSTFYIPSSTFIMFTTNNDKVNVPNDNLEQPIIELNDFGFYGEVTQNKLMPEDIRYRGKFKEGNIYKTNDEVVHNNELYICKTGSELHMVAGDISDVNKFVKVTNDNISDYYNSGLPTYKWLADELGIPLGADISVMTNGELSEDKASSGLINSSEGWIKCYNKAKQIIYIAKKPICTDIPYRELMRRFLCGHGSRTIRIGLSYYNVRLLEYQPTRTIDPMYKKSSASDKNNIENEITLFSNLMRNLSSYSFDDLGIDSESNFNYINKGTARIYKNVSLYEIDAKAISEDDYDNNKGNRYYRPVLELVREDRLPFRRPRNLPGSMYLEYDKWADVGYYGMINSSTLLNSNEIRMMLGLSELNLTEPTINYHKFYWHGMTLYIPNKPIGNGVTSKKLAEIDALYGVDKDNYIYIKENKYAIMSPNLFNTYYVMKSSEVDITKPNLKNTHKSSVVGELLARINTKLNNMLYGTNTDPVIDVWKNDDTIDINGVIFKDIVIGGIVDNDTLEDVRRVTIKNDAISYTDSYEDQGYFLPIIVSETHELTNDFTCPTIDKQVATIGSQDVTVTRYRVVRKEIEKERYVLATREVTKTRPITVTSRRPNGTIYFNTTVKPTDDDYGVLIYVAKKTDNAYITDPLYDQKQLNIRRSTDGVSISYSDRYSNMDMYYLRTIMSITDNSLVCKPHHISKTFATPTQLKTYIRTLIPTDIELGTLKNYVASKPTPIEGKPIGMFYGNTTSELTYFPIIPTFNLYNPALNYSTRLNISPLIRQEGKEVKHTLPTLPDINGDTKIVSFTNTLLPYETYLQEGRDLLDSFMLYMAHKLGMKTTVDGFIESKKELISQYVFGVLGVQLSKLYFLKGNGILYGDMYSPILRKFADDYIMPDYFSDAGNGTGDDFLDIFNPQQGYDEFTETIMEEYTVEEQYMEKETYTEVVYVEEKYQEVVSIPTFTYN